MTAKMIKTISLIGSGNVATHLGMALKMAGYDILSVYSRQIEKAEKLAERLEAEPCDNLETVGHADLAILAVPDKVVVWVAGKLEGKQPFMVHVSGSTEMDVLEPFSDNFGVVYPLQTFSVFRPVDFKNIPVCVEGSSEEITEALMAMASDISGDVRGMGSNQRLRVHLAAVFASNFVNYLNIEAADILENAGVSRDILFPLMKETLDKMLEHHPKEAQTGPAKRKDYGTMGKHIEALNLAPDKQKVYRVLSEQIQRTFQK